MLTGFSSSYKLKCSGYHAPFIKTFQAGCSLPLGKIQSVTFYGILCPSPWSSSTSSGCVLIVSQDWVGSPTHARSTPKLLHFQVTSIAQSITAQRTRFLKHCYIELEKMASNRFLHSKAHKGHQNTQEVREPRNERHRHSTCPLGPLTIVGQLGEERTGEKWTVWAIKIQSEKFSHFFHCS